MENIGPGISQLELAARICALQQQMELLRMRIRKLEAEAGIEKKPSERS